MVQSNLGNVDLTFLILLYLALSFVKVFEAALIGLEGLDAGDNMKATEDHNGLGPPTSLTN